MPSPLIGLLIIESFNVVVVVCHSDVINMAASQVLNKRVDEIGTSLFSYVCTCVCACASASACTVKISGIWLANATQMGMFYCYLRTFIICKSTFHRSAVGCVSVFRIVFCLLLCKNNTLSIITLL